MVGPENSHDPMQPLKQLRQILSADKLSVGFFIGAGCPTSVRIPKAGSADSDPLIPDIKGLTTKVVDHVGKISGCKVAFQKLIKILNEDGDSSPTVETMLNRIRALRDVAGKSNVRGLTFEELDELDSQICQTISKIVSQDLPIQRNAYHALAEFVKHRSYPSCEIFTSNYDLLVEQALEFHKAPYFDGFIGVASPFFDQRAIEEDKLPERWARVWKLHGSISWCLNKKSKSIFRSKDKADGDVELLIHPSHRKYDESRRMPYFVMMDRLRSFLKNEKKDAPRAPGAARLEGKPVALIVIGYSFADEHINEIIIQNIKANPSAAVFALQYGKLSDYPIAESLGLSNSNLSVLARDAAVIRRQKCSWKTRPGTDLAAMGDAVRVHAPPAIASPAGGPAQQLQPAGEQAQPCDFMLGDFAEFGKFLDVVYGSSGASALGTQK